MSAVAMGTRERLIEAAEAELIRGEGQLEMQAVAKRAQASVGLAYHHFGSKAGLIAATVETFYGRLDATAFSGSRPPWKTWVEREKGRIAETVRFHYADPFAFLAMGVLSRSPEVRDVETVFINRQLASGALMIEAAQRDKIIAIDIDPHLIIALMMGGIRQVLIGALMREHRPDPETLTDEIWAFMTGALRLTENANADLGAHQKPV